MIDANQKWDVDEAIARVRALAKFDLWWMEEPTSPDDVLGHARIAEAIRPIGVATGENCANRVLFKQLLQAKAIDFCQIDSCRLGGVNENVAVILLAARYGVPVCPHAGGVGLCELVQHLSMFDYLAVSGRMRMNVPRHLLMALLVPDKRAVRNLIAAVALAPPTFWPTVFRFGAMLPISTILLFAVLISYLRGIGWSVVLDDLRNPWRTAMMMLGIRQPSPTALG